MPAPAPLPITPEPQTRPPASDLRIRPHRGPAAFAVEAGNRLRLLSIVGIGGFLAGFFMSQLIAYLEGLPICARVLTTPNLIALAGALVSGLFFLAARQTGTSVTALYFEREARATAQLRSPRR